MKNLLKKLIQIIFSYILNEVRPSPVAVTYALEILIRLVRHSPISTIKIANTSHLLEIIIEHFMPLSTDALGFYIYFISHKYFHIQILINIY